MQLLQTLLLSLLYMFRALLAHHRELAKTVRAACGDGNDDGNKRFTGYGAVWYCVNVCG